MPNSKEKGEVIIFAKPPIIGKVKTRLAKDIGEKKALKVYQELLQLTLNVFIDFKNYTLFWASEELPATYKWVQANQKNQRGGDLGERMLNAVKESYNKLPYHKVVIGTDCPDITDTLIKEAFVALQTNEVVIGPSEDGGYYLIGMQRPIPELYREITWSTDQVLSQTLSICKKNGYRYHLLATLNDIDTLEDLKKSSLAYLLGS